MPNKCVQPGIRRRATCRRVGEVSLPLHWTAIEVTMSAVLRVALPLPLPTLFDYLPPAAGEACAGSRVLVPFGRRQLVGVVVAIEAEASVDRHRLKQALRLLDGEALLDAELMQSLAWAADYWLGAPGEVCINALPLALREARPLPPIGDEYWALTPAGRAAHDGGARRGGSKALLTLLATGLFFLRTAPYRRALPDGTHAALWLHVIERAPGDGRAILNEITAVWHGADRKSTRL